MADFIMFNTGKDKLLNTGLPNATELEFALSTRDCNTHVATSTYAGGFGEITTGTGYARKKQKPPESTEQKKVFAEMEWLTGSATDWPASVKSVVCITGGNTLVCAWNLQAGGAARDLSAANTTEKFTPTLTLT